MTTADSKSLTIFLAPLLLCCCSIQLCKSNTCSVRTATDGVYNDYLITSPNGSHVTLSVICKCYTEGEPKWDQLNFTLSKYEKVPNAYTVLNESQNLMKLVNYTVTESIVLVCGDNHLNYAKAIYVDIEEPKEECSTSAIQQNITSSNLSINATESSNNMMTSTMTMSDPWISSVEADLCSTTIVTAVITSTEVHTSTTTQTITSTLTRIIQESQTTQTTTTHRLRPATTATIDANTSEGNDSALIYTSVVSVVAAILFIAVMVLMLLLVVVWKRASIKKKMVTYEGHVAINKDAGVTLNSDNTATTNNGQNLDDSAGPSTTP